jgi:phosphatidylinositol alpha 1,6-mannosyltransferase
MSQPLRIAIVTESFLPRLNGVTTSVCRVLEHLRTRGHEALVVCPGPAPDHYAGFPVVAVPAVSYRRFPVGLPTRAVERAITAFAPDVVHAASPFVLGAAGLSVARRLGIPSVAVYQTDVAGFARRHWPGAPGTVAWRWLRYVHEMADLTLAPSVAAAADLTRHGIPRVGRWARGVDSELFHPRRRVGTATELRRRLAPSGQVLVGYVGRLAPEKRVHRLATLNGLPGVRLAVVGDGPSAGHVARCLPGAAMLGQREATALADAYAALDVFVHTGTEETFGQTIQEAMATGLPVVAPAAGGPIDLVRSGATGLLYAPEDDAALRVAVERLVDDPDLRVQLGHAARKAVAGRTWSAVGDELLAHFRALIAQDAVAA